MIPHNDTFCQYMYLISNLRVPMCGTAVDANARAPPFLYCNYLIILGYYNVVIWFPPLYYPVTTTYLPYSSN